MELLKVFVGDGVNVGTTIDTMVKGDILVLNASDKSPYVSGSGDIIVAACTDKGVIYSTPINKSNVVYTSYIAPSSATEAEATAVMVAKGSTPAIAAGTTISLGIQIKEDLRMGTYNKNTEVIASFVAPSSAAAETTEAASVLAKGFAANPLTSAGSPYQLVQVERTCTTAPGAGIGAAVTVTKGAREFTTASAITLTAGDVITINGGVYLVEIGGTSVQKFTLDTAFQGTSGTYATGTGATQAGKITLDANSKFGFTFKGVAQTQKNRYDQFRMVDFVVITPKGNDSGFFTITKTANTPTAPVGSYRQVRDLEEKAYTNANPLINYREFPFEDFSLNVDPTKTYGIFTITYNAGWGYNMLQSSQNSFPQTLVVCAPAQTGGQFDLTGGSPAGSSFAQDITAWYGTFSSGVFTDL